MILTRPITAAVLLALFASAAITAGPARAEGPGNAAVLASECASLREALERANAEISALKRSERGVRDDYRLRKKMAEAEALAQRLTAAESQLRTLHGATPARPAAAEASDAPAVLEARADILSDQARRLGAEAAALGRASEQLRARQLLRRRAGQLDQDPFAGIESSKRQMFVTGGRTLSTASNGKGGAQDTATKEGAAPGVATDSSRPTGAPTPTPAAGDPKTPSGGGPITSGPGPQQIAPPPRSDSPAPGAGFASGPPPPPPPTASSSPIARALIDPAAVAELRRAEAAGQSLTDAEKMARAAAALRARVQALEAEAAALRARAARH
jgi:hypothetical protein